ncbi:uncharacterized protein LOC129751350 [Uranotaenia lowii]|uniref:uncharacterized protein LOC129751350 n=1 Tax=Uranotaenia lowii TaxID=190385 RepID=UPI00247B2B54|nr:uncharacterized protein LOC129751350 [Uranotaenia lowii]
MVLFANKLVFIALLGAIWSLDAGHSLDFDCSYRNNQNWCTIANLSLASGTDLSKLTFANESLIYLKEPSVEYLSAELLNRMIVVDKMEVDGGTVPKLYIKPTLTRISAHRNRLAEVVIDAEDNFNLEHLGIAYNLLKKVPKNVRYLKNLARLHLHDNQIEVVDMDQFGELPKLKVLALHRNKIVRLDTTRSLKLVHLEELFLYGNQLEDLFLKLWDFPNLGTFHMAANRLSSVPGFVGKFPQLTTTSFGGNQWNCVWLILTLKQLVQQAQKLSVQGDKQCLGNKVGGICCNGAADELSTFIMDTMNEQYLRMNIWMIKQERAIDGINEAIESLKEELFDSKLKNIDRFADLEDATRRVENNMKSSFSDFRKELERIQADSPKQVLEQFEWFEEKLHENRALIDNVIEDLYLAEIEKNDNKTQIIN